MPCRHAFRLLLLVLLVWPMAARAQTDEIEIYDAVIAEPGQFDATLHNNYAPNGLTQPRFPGATVSNHSWNGTLETAYGVTEWWELGLYMPVYSYAQGGPQFDGGKLRSLFVVPDAAHQIFFLRSECRGQPQQQALGGPFAVAGDQADPRPAPGRVGPDRQPHRRFRLERRGQCGVRAVRAGRL